MAGWVEILRSRRARWVGVASAAVLVFGMASSSNAAVTSGVRNVYVPMSPCRLADTRPAPDTVGAKNTPLGAGQSMTLNGRGVSGNCNLPSDTTALALNVTTLGATAPSYITVWPAGIARPIASSLNPSPGAPPTPNAVTTPLSAGGQFNVYNDQGSLNIIVDVVGYFADHNFDDRYVPKTTPQAVAMTTYLGGVMYANWNVTAITWDAAQTRYVVDLPFSYVIYSYDTQVTPVGGCAGFVNTDSVSGDLLISFTNTSGTRIQCGFSLVVHNPTP